MVANQTDLSDLSSIEEIENIWITMPDGIRLAARLWRPRDAFDNPVAAILEYIPYRKRDFMRQRDEPMHRYYALNGFASIRVDLRGTGDSEGVLEDEYTALEHEDAVSIIEWLAAQRWCNGAVGMTGISWGGFNALQVAALAPPALKAIIALCASDDRYADDAHYKGGCLLNENMQWGSILTMYNSLPPDPHIVGEAWRSMWKDRIDALKPFPAVWMQHPWRDQFWRHGSICEDYRAIKCPVYIIGGWADGYTNSVFRLLERLSVPRKGLIGPWGHAFPQDAIPGPQIGYLQEAVRWWRHWLIGTDTGIMREPILRAWIQDWVPPRPQYSERPGRWISEEQWPSQRIRRDRYHFGWGVLSKDPQPTYEIGISSPHSVGIRAGEWCGFGVDGEAPRDQRADDGGSLLFETEPLAEPLDLFGTPELMLEVMSDRPVAFLIARLCDVEPSGRSSRISYGILNLCHRNGHGAPEPLEPGKWYFVRMKLDDLGQNIPAGHHLRLAISTGYWPTIWPAPEPVHLTIRTSRSTIEMPVRQLGDERPLDPFQPPLAAPGTQYRKIRPLEMQRSVRIDLAKNEMIYTLSGDGGEFGGAELARLDDIDLELGYRQTKRYRIIEDEVLSAETEFSQSVLLSRQDWRIEVDCQTHLSATVDQFCFRGVLEARENGVQFARRKWSITIPRQLL